jgi:serine/threonine protein kinase
MNFDNMTIVPVLGKGGYGVVKLLEDRFMKQRIAVKYLNDASGPEGGVLTKMMKEVETMIRLEHPAVVGFCLPRRGSPAGIGREFAVNRSLRAALDHEPRHTSLDGTGIASTVYGLFMVSWRE